MQFANVVVDPCAMKFSVTVAPGAMVCWDEEGSMYKVPLLVWKLPSHTASMRSPGSSTASSQPLIVVLPSLTMVNLPWKLCGC